MKNSIKILIITKYDEKDVYRLEGKEGVYKDVGSSQLTKRGSFPVPLATMFVALDSSHPLALTFSQPGPQICGPLRGSASSFY